MKTKFFYSIILVMGLLFAGSSFNYTNAMSPKKTSMKQDSVKYTCPMHPEVVMNKPGKCPKCGMALEVKKDTKNGSMDKMDKMDKMDNKKDSSMMKDSSKMKEMPM